jgi:hypothetical protein
MNIIIKKFQFCDEIYIKVKYISMKFKYFVRSKE